ncbi:hypothetical protein V9T40_013535 [Parthenolecanium corni]|uniref:Uncharacterized protein n=1 Tax=Parthenolecanium corni TaxID=536013 RepID=A0AAN9TBE6_9HEMI
MRPGRERDATPANDAREGVDGAPLIATRPDTTEARSSGVPRKPGDEHPTAARQPQPANDAETPNGVAVSNGKAPSNPVSASARPEPEPPRSSEPILIPKLRIDFVDFPYLHYSMRLEAAHLGDLLRISVRTGAKTPRGPLPDFHGPRGDHGHRRSERCSSRSRPYLPASGFQGLQRSQRKENSSRIPRRLLRVHSGYPDEAHDNATRETPTLRV